MSLETKNERGRAENNGALTADGGSNGGGGAACSSAEGRRRTAVAMAVAEQRVPKHTSVIPLRQFEKHDCERFRAYEIPA